MYPGRFETLIGNHIQRDITDDSLEIANDDRKKMSIVFELSREIRSQEEKIISLYAQHIKMWAEEEEKPSKKEIKLYREIRIENYM